MTTIYLGTAPAEEDTAQLGVTADFARLNRLECEAYRRALVRVLGEPPPGVTLRTKAESHDFGTYRELVATVDERTATAETWAWVELAEQGLATWSGALMWPPANYHDSQAIHEIALDALDGRRNPFAHASRAIAIAAGQWHETIPPDRPRLPTESAPGVPRALPESVA